jgi:pimeloyl-ACP methyl ester carboxylesterase
VAALVLIDTGPGYRSDDGRAKWNRMAEGYADDLDQRGLAALGGSGELEAAAHRDATGLAHAARRVLTQSDASVVDSLPTIAVPVLVIVGERDKPFLAGSSYMADKIAGAELVVIPGAGHAPNVTHTAEFDAHLRAFLDRLEVPR